MTAQMLIGFVLLLLMAMPVGYSLVISGWAALSVFGPMPSSMAVMKIFQPTQSFPLLAIPFFILSGGLMMSGKLGQKLVGLASMLVGKYHGGLGQVTVVGSTVFGGVSGSSVAEASALGSMLIPWQKREGYPGAFGAAVTSASSVIAGLMPPSIPLILFATVSNTSIASLFIAAVIPALMLAGGMMLACNIIGRRRGFPRLTLKYTGAEIRNTLFTALPALLMPVFIVVLLRAGIATPTEVSVIAVAYALVVSTVIYRDLTAERVMSALVNTVITTGIVMLIIAAANIIAYILTSGGVPQAVAQWAVEYLKHPILIILAINLLMLFIGMFLDLPAAILLLGPTLVSIANAIGLDLVQLGIIMCVNLSIGLFTPPIGTTLFVSSAIARERIGAVVKELGPFYLVAIVVLLLVSYVPALIIY
ncbi:TRAP transporter large permease [Halomonas sp. ATBC28]|jgi:tripartite ATP-independent transporter DctM subunit|uniref:TRAP transporter large permease protein n=2 Tax=Vreelandella titanicae TaxID=664683 RepID=L9U6N4_9GAMM|nr:MULTISPECIES: TRAP transporter large permease [Halomonas]ELY20550.1 TRAP dicarboxylate transporter, DctM subunit [Halomonas titanicae BH1]NAO95437.1 TRAP transporter large permease subunit [Halomonas sp. MG34]NVE90389.1 TRAP transporter large permease [Halomonas titanicae]TMU18195.1 TRAP transporter large permease [Halomonas sp. ATBC28]|tara:strand:- start:3757 stop:5016 length:1260 start_codon:yes stop_codon:yes gene_type:complete